MAFANTRAGARPLTLKFMRMYPMPTQAISASLKPKLHGQGFNTWLAPTAKTVFPTVDFLNGQSTSKHFCPEISNQNQETNQDLIHNHSGNNRFFKSFLPAPNHRDVSSAQAVQSSDNGCQSQDISKVLELGLYFNSILDPLAPCRSNSQAFRAMVVIEKTASHLKWYCNRMEKRHKGEGQKENTLSLLEKFLNSPKLMSNTELSIEFKV